MVMWVIHAYGTNKTPFVKSEFLHYLVSATAQKNVKKGKLLLGSCTNLK